MPKPAADRHKDHSTQYNVRIPKPLKAAYAAACRARGVLPADMTRTLMQGFVDLANEAKPGSRP